MDSERFAIVIEARPDDRLPGAIRLRRLLKQLLRLGGFRCVRVERVDTAGVPTVPRASAGQQCDVSKGQG